MRRSHEDVPAIGAGLSSNRFAFWSLLVSGVVVLSVGLSGCSGKKSAFSGKGSPTYNGSGPLPKGGGVYKVGNPYWVAGKKYYPRVDDSYDRTGMASWYGPKFHRRMTANGEWFDMNRITAAHKTLPLPSFVRVTNLENNRTIVVRLNDRGPYAHDRIIDLSKKSAQLLGFKQQGTARVRVTYMGRAPLNGDDYYVASRKAGRPIHASYDPTNVDVGKPVIRGNADGITTASLGSVTKHKTGGVFIQAAAFSQRDNAHRTKAKLVDMFGSANMETLGTFNNPLYKVSVGPFSSQADARDSLEQIQQEGLPDARIITR